VQNKIELISVAKSLGIPIISSMGAGDKLDPTKFTVADIYSTTICPLAKIMRKELKKRGVDSLKVVYSTEKPVKKHHYNNIKNNDVSVDNNDNVELCNNPNGKDNENRIIGSISFVPSVAGLIIAGEVVNDLIKKQSNTRVSH
jgi:tRNA A37 threonylcarbamoyladenosine dehydratase